MPEYPAETALVINACAVFDEASLDVETNARVIAYLSQRYTAGVA